MIDHKYKCIFIHNRKCAGSTIVTSFGSLTKDEIKKYNDGILSNDWDLRHDYFIFSVVRNPFDRVISAWQYLDALRERPLFDVLQNPPREGHDFRHFTRQQVKILGDPRSGSLVCNKLIRFEHLQRDFDTVCDLIGKNRSVLPQTKVNLNRKKDYRSYYEKNTKYMVENMFGDDLEAFGYTF
jgi:hypothetical protein